MQVLAYPGGRRGGHVSGGLDPLCLQQLAPLPPDSPDILDLGALKGGIDFSLALEYADALKMRVLFCQAVGKLGKRFCRRDADADRNAGILAHALAQKLGIIRQVEACEARHIKKRFIDRIDFDFRGESGERCHYP